MIHLRVLGPVDLRGPDGRAIQSVIAQEKRLALLTYLAVSRRGDMCRRDRLLGVFWPESDEGRARNALSQAIFHLRKSLGEETVVGRGAEELGTDPGLLWCDVRAFDDAVAAGDLAGAVELYRGPLLEGIGAVSDAPEWEHWLDAERTRLERMHAEAVRTLARGREEVGDFPGAIALWKRLAEILPYDTEVALRLMQAHAESGARAEALLHARAFQARLRDDLDADPDPEVEARAERLRSTAPAAPHSAGSAAQGAVHSLPAPTSPLIGRTAEMVEVRRALLRDDVRLLTLIGPGGVGKTRLGLEVARGFLAELSYEVAFVELAGVAEPARVLPAIASALGVREEGSLPLVDKLREHLRPRRILLLLDNFEHVLGAAPEVAALLDAAPRLKLLATSRAALRVAAEHERPVSPLAVPDPARTVSAGELLRFGAVELFVARARAVKPDFELTAGNAGAVTEICARLDGLPLAIELAAARTRVLTPPSLVARLGQRLKLLTGGPADRPARQQTLRGAIEWSYDLLDEAERGLFRRLAVFRGGCRLEAVEEVCASREGGSEVLDLLESLIAKSLVSRADVGDGSRYGMLDTLAEFADERLRGDAREAEEALRAHAAFYLRLAESAESRLGGAEQGVWLSRLSEEHENLRAVLDRARESGDVATMLRIAAAIWRFWWLRGHLSEGRRWIADALELATDEEGATERWRGKALLAASALALYQGDLAVARRLGEDALRAFESTGDHEGIATALYRLGQEAWKQKDYESARARYDRSLAILRELGQSRAVAGLLFMMGSLEIDQGRFDEGRRLYGECLDLNRELGDPELGAMVLLNLGMVAYRAGDLHTARARLEEGIEVVRSVGNKQHLAGALNTLGTVARDLGDLDTARARLEESCALQRELGDRLGLAHSAHSIGSLDLRAGRPAAAAPMLRESLRIFGDLGVRPPAECVADLGELLVLRGAVERGVRLLGMAARICELPGCEMTAADREHFERNVALSRALVAGDVWTREWEAGRLAGSDENFRRTIDEALDEGGSGLA